MRLFTLAAVVGAVYLAIATRSFMTDAPACEQGFAYEDSIERCVLVPPTPKGGM